MDLDVSDSGLSKPVWPIDHVHLTPAFLDDFQGRLRLLNSEFRHFMEKQDPKVGIDLNSLLVNFFQPAFYLVEFIAMQVPRTVAVNPSVAAATSALVSQLQALIGEDNTPDFLSEIEALPNPDWDALFQGYCRVLEASVDAFIMGDSPVYQVKLAKASEPSKYFRSLRKAINLLERFPFLRSYHNRLIRKLESSRSGAVYTDWWMRQIPENSVPPPKRKIDTLGLDDRAKKRLLKQMNKYPKLDRLLSSPPE
ncbi:hypothetical protein CHU98_g1092 [Xylaria longipes]|nr:hypothetical protein CHU98_g1092 [Xylaria longipes]